MKKCLPIYIPYLVSLAKVWGEDKEKTEILVRYLENEMRQGRLWYVDCDRRDEKTGKCLGHEKKD